MIATELLNKKTFEDCFINSLEESVSLSMFHEKIENPWRKLVKFIFIKYTDGMNLEEKSF